MVMKKQEELQKLQSLITELKNSKKIILDLVYPAIKRRNNSNKITICGGSYNPFHTGHKELITRTLEYVDGSEAVAFITLENSLGKPFTGADYAQRLYLLRLEQKRLPFMSIGLVNNGFYKNWFHRLREFHSAENNKYACVMGTDLFPKVIGGNKEKDYPRIFSVDWLVAERSGKTWKDFNIPFSAQPYLNRISHVGLSPNVGDVSSSGLKDLLNQRNKKVLKYISKDAFDFIKEQKIFF